MNALFQRIQSIPYLRSLLILIFSIRFLQSLCMLKHGDALYYHLVGGRYWVETSLSEMTQSFHPFLLAGLFDYLYVIPNYLFGAGLLTQIVGQNMHFMFSMGFAALTLFYVFRGSLWAYIAPMLVLTISRSQDFFFYAKNDGVVASVGLLAAVVVLNKDFFPKIKAWNRMLLVGILLGLLPAIKMYGLFASLSIGLVFMYHNRKNWKAILFVIFIALLTWSPILLRNYFYLGTPFFPGLLNKFPGNLTPSMIAYLTNSLNAKVGLVEAFLHLKAAFTGKVIFLIAPILFILNYKFKKAGNSYFILTLLYIFIYAGLNGGWIFDRYYFICYFWTSLFIIKSLSSYKLKNWAIPLVILMILIDGRLDLGVKRISQTFKLYATAKDSRTIIRKISKFTEFWDYVKPNTLIISDRASEIFYAPPGIRMHNYTESREAEFLLTCKNEDLVKLRPYSYAILQRGGKNPCYDVISTKGKLLHKVYAYSLYDISKLD